METLLHAPEADQEQVKAPDEDGASTYDRVPCQTPRGEHQEPLKPHHPLGVPAGVRELGFDPDDIDEFCRRPGPVYHQLKKPTEQMRPGRRSGEGGEAKLAGDEKRRHDCSQCEQRQRRAGQERGYPGQASEPSQIDRLDGPGNRQVPCEMVERRREGAEHRERCEQRCPGGEELRAGALPPERGDDATGVSPRVSTREEEVPDPVARYTEL